MDDHNGTSEDTDFRINEAAKILRVSQQTLIRWEKLGRLTSKRYGFDKVRYYPAADIYRILEGNI